MKRDQPPVTQTVNLYLESILGESLTSQLWQGKYLNREHSITMGRKDMNFISSDKSLQLAQRVSK